MADSDAPCGPSRFQLAFALAITKTKPVGLTIRDYVTKLRQHLVEGNVTENYGSRDQYLDAASHWQSLFQEGQHEINHLQTKISSLERDKARLEAQVSALKKEPVIKQEEPSRPSTAQPKSSVQKRKNVVKDDTQLQHKKLRVSNGTVGGSMDAPIVLVDEMSRFEDEGLEPEITRHLLCIHKLYHVNSPVRSDLAYHLVQATKGITEHIVRKAVDIQRQLQQASAVKDRTVRARRTANVLAVLNNDFKKSQRAAARSFGSVFHGLETLWSSGTESGKRNHGVVTYEMICGFDQLAEAIQTTCEMHANMTSDEEVPLKRNRAADEGKKVKRVDRAPVPQELTTLLLAMFSGLTAKEQGPHSAFFEGFLYLLLDRVARKLSLMTFKHVPGRTIKDEIDLEDLSARQLSTTTTKAINMEVQFLTQLTDRTLKLAPGFLGSLSNVSAATKSKTARPSTATRSNARTVTPRTSLSIAAKEKLQHTLVRCMFGEFPRTVHTGDSDTEDDVGPGSEFVDVLRKPVPMGPVPPPPKVDDVDIATRFREDMWRLIGWDILSRADEW